MCKDIIDTENPCCKDTFSNDGYFHDAHCSKIKGLVIGLGNPAILDKCNFKIDISSDNTDERHRNYSRHGPSEKEPNNHDHQNISIVILYLEIRFPHLLNHVFLENLSLCHALAQAL